MAKQKGDFRRRFSKDEFRKELVEHLSAMPKEHLNSPKKMEDHAAKKAEYYARAMSALDDAKARLEKIKQTHPEQSAKDDADAAIRQIDAAVNAYGDASLNQNGDWNNPWDVDPE